MQEEIIYDKNGCEIIHKSPGDIFAMNITFFPVHINDPKHWFLMAALMQKKLILYRDSSRERVRAGIYLNLVKEYIFNEFNHRNGRHMTDSEKNEWKYERVVFGPTTQQTNGYDCGMYVCSYAYFLLFSLPEQFNQKIIDDLRSKFVHSILHGGNTMFHVV
jgi:sentrin-specific protease 1